MGIAASMRVGIHLGAGNAEQAHVSARVTICFGCKYLHGKVMHVKDILFIGYRYSGIKSCLFCRAFLKLIFLIFC